VKVSKMLSPESVAAATARLVSRRRLLRNAGTVALGTAMTTAYFGMRPEVAQACTFSSVCGPSPLCGPSRCSGYSCVPSTTTKWMKYGLYQCGTNANDNCWSVCRNNILWYCCDCCAKNAGCTTNAQPCTGCGSTGWTSCICRAQVRSC
jgi:hypothetical protein